MIRKLRKAPEIFWRSFINIRSSLSDGLLSINPAANAGCM